jgi:dipeptidyl aminopeptidase/acylaminoacyl peptidase
MEMFAALKVLGVDTRMLMVKGETHELSRSGRPRNRIVRMREILNWMDKYLKPETEGKEEK